MTSQFSYLTHLECSQCGTRYRSDQVQTYCHECQAPLMARYDLDEVRANVNKSALRQRQPGMWRWHEVLPIQKAVNVLTLGEGDTPLLPSRRLGKWIGFDHLFIKDEGQNPTGSFKARGLSAAISKAKELGVEKVIIPTAGNAGGAMAAYAASGGLQARVVMPRDTPLSNQIETRITGAEVSLVEGLISDAAEQARRDILDKGWFDTSTFKEPYRVEGKKIMGYELAESFLWDLPEVIIYPTGGGTGLIGMWKAFAELNSLGWLKSPFLPRMVVVQADGCAPVVTAFEKRATQCEFWPNAQTIASGLRVPKSFADQLIMETIYASQGFALAVSDEEILAAQLEIAQMEGIFTAPEGAATWAAFKKLAGNQWISSGERVVLFNTGSGLKYLDSVDLSTLEIT